MKKLLLMGLCALLLGGCTKAKDEGAVHLRVWVGDNADVPWMEQVVREFQAARPDRMYDIQIGVQNEGDVARVILSDAESAADVFTFADDQFASLQQSGVLMPVEEGAQEIISSNAPPMSL